jgi:hypothetical protein
VTGQTLTEQELFDLRDEATDWMPDRGIIYRLTKTDDEYGGQTETEAEIKADVPLTIESGASHEQLEVLGDAVRGSQIFTLTFPAGTDVQVTDHVAVLDHGGLDLTVQAVMDPESWEIERRAIAIEQ